MLGSEGTIHSEKVGHRAEGFQSSAHLRRAAQLVLNAINLWKKSFALVNDNPAICIDHYTINVIDR